MQVNAGTSDLIFGSGSLQRSANVGVESSRRRCARIAIAVRQHVLGTSATRFRFHRRKAVEGNVEPGRHGAEHRTKKVIRRREAMKIFARGSKDIARR